MLKKILEIFFTLALLQTSLFSNKINIDKILKSTYQSNNNFCVVHIKISLKVQLIDKGRSSSGICLNKNKV